VNLPKKTLILLALLRNWIWDSILGYWSWNNFTSTGSTYLKPHILIERKGLYKQQKIWSKGRSWRHIKWNCLTGWGCLTGRGYTVCLLGIHFDFSVLNFRPGPKLVPKSNLWNVIWVLQAIISGNFNWASLWNNVPKTVLKDVSSSFFNFNFPIAHIYPRESQTSEYFQHYSGHFFGGI